MAQRGLMPGVLTLNCSATAPAITLIHQKIKWLTSKTPPVLSGTAAGQFAANLNPVKRSGRPTVSASPKICPEIINIGRKCSTAALGGKRAGETAFQEGALASLGSAWTTVVTISGRACSGAREARRSTVTRRAFNPWAPCKSANSTSSVSSFK